MNMALPSVSLCFLVLSLFVATYARDGNVLSQPQKLRCYADIAFALDGSGSVGRENWQKTLEFVWRFAGSLPFDLNRFGVVSFGNEAYVDVRLGDFYDYESFKRRVEQIRYLDENTNTADGIRKLRSLFGGYDDRPEVPNIGIIITDGVATVEREAMDNEADMARREGINLFGIGIGSEYDQNELLDLIRNSARLFSAENFNDLLLNLEKIVGLACQDEPAPTPPPDTSCGLKNIAFVVDASGSVTTGKFEDAKLFLKNFVNDLPFEYNYGQLALVTYSTEAFVKAKFDEVKSKEEMLMKIDLLEHVNQRTNLSGAINVVRDQIFLSKYKFGVNDNVVIVLTDMASNTDVEKLPMEAELAKQVGLKIFTIGLEDSADMHEMAMLSSEPKNHFMHFVPSYKVLSSFEASRAVKEAVCTHPYPEYSLDLRENECFSDIVFAIESKNREDFEKIKQILIALARKLGNCLYGVVMLTERAFTAVSFDSYESVSGFISNVERLPYTVMQANLLSGLQVVDNMFNTRPQSVNLGTMRHPQRRFGISQETSVMKSVDLSQLVVLITEANYYTDLNQLKFHLGNIKKEKPNVGCLTLGYGSQVDVNLMKTISTHPHSLFMIMESNLDVVLQDKIDLVASAISTVTAAPYYSCDFEKVDEAGLRVADTCDFVQLEDDDANWLVISGATLSDLTGPKQAFNGSFYAYLEATGLFTGAKAVLEKPSYMGGRMKCCMTFYVNMYGHHSGKLEVFTKDPFGKETVAWMMHGPQGDEWMLGMAELVVPDGGKIGFRVSRGTEYSSDIALDSVSAHYGACPIMKQFPAEYSKYRWWS